MFLPQKLVPTEVLCRLPVPKEIQKVISNKDNTILLDMTSVVKSFLQQIRDYYRSVLTEDNGEKQRKAPLIAEVFMTCDSCEETVKKGYKEGDYVFIKNFSLVEAGIDDEKEYYYFFIHPNNLGSIYSKEDGKIIFNLFADKEVFEEENVELNQARQKLAQSNGMPIMNLENKVGEVRFNKNGLGLDG